MEHVRESGYRSAWEQTRAQACVGTLSVAKSRFFFEPRSSGDGVLLANGRPVPRRFDTFALICCLPFPAELREAIEHAWQYTLATLDRPAAYGVQPENRHVEIFLFQRPGESFAREVIDQGILASRRIADSFEQFRIEFRSPFMTPDGTVVMPGYDDPPGAVDTLRSRIRTSIGAYPRQQSQWLHTSLGRVLEPLDRDRCRPLLEDMERAWGTVIGTVDVDELLWTHEKQWYMMDRDVLHRQPLRAANVE